MPTSLLEILRAIPDHRRAEGRRFDLATVLLYAILSMVAGANSYRQMHEFIRIHRQRMNEAFGLALRGAPSSTASALAVWRNLTAPRAATMTTSRCRKSSCFSLR